MSVLVLVLPFECRYEDPREVAAAARESELKLEREAQEAAVSAQNAAMKEQDARQKAAAKHQAERAKALWLTLPEYPEGGGEYCHGNALPKPPRFRGKIEAGRDGYKCEICGTLHEGEYGSGRFCGQGCRNRANGEKAAVIHQTKDDGVVAVKSLDTSSSSPSSFPLSEEGNSDVDNNGTDNNDGRRRRAQLYGTGIMGALASLPVGWWQATQGSNSNSSRSSTSPGQSLDRGRSEKLAADEEGGSNEDDDDDDDGFGEGEDQDQDLDYGGSSGASASSSSSSAHGSRSTQGPGSGGGGKARKWVDVRVACWVQGQLVQPSWQMNVIHMQVQVTLLWGCTTFLLHH